MAIKFEDGDTTEYLEKILAELIEYGEVMITKEELHDMPGLKTFSTFFNSRMRGTVLLTVFDRARWAWITRVVEVPDER